VRYRTVLFDLDGTLIDSGGMILASFRHATRTVLAREIPDEELVAAVGGSTMRDQMHTFDPEHVDELVDAYRAHNLPLHDELEVFPGIAELLDELRGEGRTLGIVTSKHRPSVDRALGLVGLEDVFATIVAAGDTDAHKPDPEPVLTALARLGSSPEEAAFVGDSPFDMGAGSAAGVFTIGVSWGGLHAEERLREAGADTIVDTPQELLDAL
jgi:pyrophosphatase PpaX